jgi:hypothetical protein
MGPVYANQGPPIPSPLIMQSGPQFSQVPPYSQNWRAEPPGSLVPTTRPEVTREEPREILIGIVLIL